MKQFTAQEQQVLYQAFLRLRRHQRAKRIDFRLEEHQFRAIWLASYDLFQFRGNKPSNYHVARIDFDLPFTADNAHICPLFETNAAYSSWLAKQRWADLPPEEATRRKAHIAQQRRPLEQREAWQIKQAEERARAAFKRREAKERKAIQAQTTAHNQDTEVEAEEAQRSRDRLAAIAAPTQEPIIMTTQLPTIFRYIRNHVKPKSEPKSDLSYLEFESFCFMEGLPVKGPYTLQREAQGHRIGGLVFFPDSALLDPEQVRVYLAERRAQRRPPPRSENWEIILPID